MSKELEAVATLVEIAIYGNKENNRGKIFAAETLLKQALERSKPALVIEGINYKGDDVYLCGKCHTRLRRYNQNYCPQCGTKTGWSDMHKLLDDQKDFYNESNNNEEI